ncbi:MAG: xylan 1,4-beta-xylosidase [Verrucomicrobiota bacterium]
MTAGDQRQARPPKKLSNATAIKPGDRWPTDNKFRWLVGELEIPATIGKESSAGKIAGLQLNVGDGGEVWVGGELQCRFDNDHPALVILSTNVTPGATSRVEIQVYGKVQGGDKFDQANWVIIDSKRAIEPLGLTVDPKRDLGRVPDGIVGLSQGGGVSDYEDATAAKLREGGFKWFRMDNVFTGALKKDKATGELVYDWRDLDKRVDFIRKMGADPILCVSYMPQVLDAVPNNDRQSAPKDYAAWEELCFQAASHCIGRGQRVPFWEVWNEVNTGWLKPGPDDTGTDEFRKLYTLAIGKEDTNTTTIRRFEAYCKLYRATALGIRRADPAANIGGPALASGPMENSKDCGHCSHGAGFARGLMLWCAQEKLPLNFVSWHEYFQPPEKIAREAAIFRGYLEDLPALKKSVASFMITEWNEAWWPDRPQDHELGAAWCANSITRAFLPAQIDRPCFFYVKQGDMNFRGDYSLLMKDNVPKASYNVARIFNGLTGRWIALGGTDGDVSGVASWDASRGRLAVVLVNFRDRYALRRPVRLQIDELPAALRNGAWQEWTVDATHGNVWHDLARAELTKTRTGTVSDEKFAWEKMLEANSVTLLEFNQK